MFIFFFSFHCHFNNFNNFNVNVAIELTTKFRQASNDLRRSLRPQDEWLTITFQEKIKNMTINTNNADTISNDIKPKTVNDTQSTATIRNKKVDAVVDYSGQLHAMCSQSPANLEMIKM